MHRSYVQGSLADILGVARSTNTDSAKETDGEADSELSQDEEMSLPDGVYASFEEFLLSGQIAFHPTSAD